MPSKPYRMSWAPLTPGRARDVQTDRLSVLGEHFPASPVPGTASPLFIRHAVPSTSSSSPPSLAPRPLLEAIRVECILASVLWLAFSVHPFLFISLLISPLFLSFFLSLSLSLSLSFSDCSFTRLSNYSSNFLPPSLPPSYIHLYRTIVIPLPSYSIPFNLDIHLHVGFCLSLLSRLPHSVHRVLFSKAFCPHIHCTHSLHTVLASSSRTLVCLRMHPICSHAICTSPTPFNRLFVCTSCCTSSATPLPQTSSRISPLMQCSLSVTFHAASRMTLKFTCGVPPSPSCMCR